MTRLYARQGGSEPEKSKGYERPNGLPRYTVATIVAWLPRLPGLPCAACRGRLHVEWPSGGGDGRVSCLSCGREYAEVVDRLPTPIAALRSDEPERRRGRPPKSATEPDSPAALCVDCNVRRPKFQRVRCQPCVFARTHPRRLCLDCQTQPVSRARWVRCSSCAFARRWSTSLARRLLALLADGQWHGRDELHAALGVSNQQLRSSVQQARDRGWAIRLVESGYRLEGLPV